MIEGEEREMMRIGEERMKEMPSSREEAHIVPPLNVAGSTQKLFDKNMTSSYNHPFIILI